MLLLSVVCVSSSQGFLLILCYFSYVFCIAPSLFLAALLSPAAKGLTRENMQKHHRKETREGSLVCDVFSCFCQFSKWCPVSGVELGSTYS